MDVPSTSKDVTIDIRLDEIIVSETKQTPFEELIACLINENYYSFIVDKYINYDEKNKKMKNLCNKTLQKKKRRVVNNLSDPTNSCIINCKTIELKNYYLKCILEFPYLINDKRIELLYILCLPTIFSILLLSPFTEEETKIIKNTFSKEYTEMYDLIIEKYKNISTVEEYYSCDIVIELFKLNNKKIIVKMQESKKTKYDDKLFNIITVLISDISKKVINN